MLVSLESVIEKKNKELDIANKDKKKAVILISTIVSNNYDLFKGVYIKQDTKIPEGMSEEEFLYDKAVTLLIELSNFTGAGVQSFSAKSLDEGWGGIYEDLDLLGTFFMRGREGPEEAKKRAEEFFEKHGYVMKIIRPSKNGWNIYKQLNRCLGSNSIATYQSTLKTLRLNQEQYILNFMAERE